MKTCSRCRQELPRANFYSHRGMRDGLGTECKSCDRKPSRATARIRAITVTDAGRQALQEAEDAEARRIAMDYLFAPLKWQTADKNPAVLSLSTPRHDGAHDHRRKSDDASR